MLESSRLNSFFCGADSATSEAALQTDGGMRSEESPELAHIAAPTYQDYYSLYRYRFPARCREFPGLAPVRYSRSGNRARTQGLRAILRVLPRPRCHRRPWTGLGPLAAGGS